MNKYICNNNLFPQKYLSVRNIKKYYINNYINTDIYTNHSYYYYNDNILSAEHIVPQSRIKFEKNANKDMHNIFLTDTYMNNQRSNYKYIDEKNYKNDLIELPNNNFKNNKDNIFIPCHTSRGIISRTICYMKLIYPDLNLNNVIDIETLKEWNELYPPNDIEYDRNKKIKLIQGNENIFIKYPKIINDLLNFKIIF